MGRQLDRWSLTSISSFHALFSNLQLANTLLLAARACQATKSCIEAYRRGTITQRTSCQRCARGRISRATVGEFGVTISVAFAYDIDGVTEISSKPYALLA